MLDVYAPTPPVADIARLEGQEGGAALTWPLGTGQQYQISTFWCDDRCEVSILDFNGEVLAKFETEGFVGAGEEVVLGDFDVGAVTYAYLMLVVDDTGGAGGAEIQLEVVDTAP